MILGSIEAGGTKFVCGIGNEDFQILDQKVIPTTTPKETLQAVSEYFKQFEIEALSIASFGPVELRKHAEKYGFITNTPKAHWKNTDIVGYLQKQLQVPIAFTTDVNGSAYGEYVLAKEQQKEVSSLVYYTVGTGIGAGAVLNGQFLGGIGHPEMGHTFVKRHTHDEGFSGICPFHQDCLEGLVAGPTFEARLNKKGETVAKEDPVWDILAYYLAQAAIQTTLNIRPEKIVFGGSVVQEHLLEKIREQFATLMQDYVEVPPLKDYLTRPLADNNGSATIGNFALAKQEL